jgi:hypothetical protein
MKHERCRLSRSVSRATTLAWLERLSTHGLKHVYCYDRWTKMDDKDAVGRTLSAVGS